MKSKKVIHKVVEVDELPAINQEMIMHPLPKRLKIACFQEFGRNNRRDKLGRYARWYKIWVAVDLNSYYITQGIDAVDAINELVCLMRHTKSMIRDMESEGTRIVYEDPTKESAVRRDLVEYEKLARNGGLFLDGVIWDNEEGVGA